MHLFWSAFARSVFFSFFIFEQSPLLSRLFEIKYFYKLFSRFYKTVRVLKKYFIFFKSAFFYMLLIKASKSRKKFLHKKRARKTFFETLLHAKIWFFLKNFGKIFLKIAADPDLSPELPPIKPEEITFSFSRCSGSRKIFFSLLRVFFKKNIFFKKNFQFFQFLQKWDFEIFCEKYFSKIIFSFFRTFRAPLLRRLFLFLQNCTRKNIFLLFLKNIFEKILCFFLCFWALKKALFRKNLFFTKIQKYAR